MFAGANRQPPMHVRREQIQTQATTAESKSMQAAYEQKIADVTEQAEKQISALKADSMAKIKAVQDACEQEKGDTMAAADKELSEYRALVGKTFDDLIAKLGADSEAGKDLVQAKSGLFGDKQEPTTSNGTPAASAAKK